MKRIIVTSLAALMFASPMATSVASADPYDHRGDRDGRWDRDRHDGDRDGRWRDRNHDGRYDRGDRWDHSRHNGYYYGGRWNYGPPPDAYYGRPGFSLGYHEWRRGDRLPSYYRGRYESVDYYRYHLRAPPRGYRYVRDDRGDVLLVGIATGVILSTILSSHY